MNQDDELPSGQHTWAGSTVTGPAMPRPDVITGGRPEHMVAHRQGVTGLGEAVLPPEAKPDRDKSPRIRGR